jgi:hypothetical protein
LLSSRAEIVEILNHPNLHVAGGQAHDLRHERFGANSSFSAVEHVAAGEHAYCPVCGQRPTQRTWLPPSLAGMSEAASELHVAAAPGAGAKILLGAAPPLGKSAHGLERSALVGVASDWMRASDGDDVRLLVEAREHGVKVMSDGVLPAIHPARGAEAGERWASYWRAAASAGLRGFASLFYGPRHDQESIADQLEAIAAVQDATQVFLSVCPVVDPGRAFGGLQDTALTHGDTDVRMLATCRLVLKEVEHLTLLYNRTDLKMAHIALLGGVDDLSGHLTLEKRSQREDANHDDLSLAEMENWMRDAGMEARLRNACFETAAP